MTLPRTIHRRNARKRAKARPRSSGPKFLVADWLIAERVRILKDQLRFARLINRQY